MAWLTGWGYRKELIIQNANTVGSLADFQLLFIVDTATLISQGKMQLDGADIRITDSDGVTLLDFWVEDGTINTSQTRIWVKVPFLRLDSQKTIYMYYGNSGVLSISSIDRTFIFGDDFNDGVVDTNKWTIGGTPSESGGLLVLNDTSVREYVSSITTFTSAYSLVFKHRAPGGAQGVSGGGFSTSNIADFGSTTDIAIVFEYTDGNVYYDILDSNLNRSRTTTPQDDLFHKYEIKRDGSTATIYKDGTQIIQAPVRPDSGYVVLTVRAGYTAEFEYAFVRKATFTEPPTTTGVEQVSDWLSGWQYRRTVTVDARNLPYSVTDYQIKISLDTASLIAAGKMNADGSDIRVTLWDGVTLLDYWIEPQTINTSTTIIWAKIPFLPTGEKTRIYVYYGNPSALDAGNIRGTFILGDDFDVLDTTYWNNDGGSASVSNGILQFSGADNRLRTNDTVDIGKELICWFRATDSAQDRSVGFLEPPSSANPWYYNMVRWYNGGYSYQAYVNGTGVYGLSGYTPDGNFHRFVLRWTSSLAEYIIDGVTYKTTTTIPTVNLSIGFRSYSSSLIEADWIVVRKYTPPEPITTVNVGEETEQAWLNGWTYRVPVIVDNSQNPNSLFDYQVKIVLDTATLIANGKMQSDGADIRVTDTDKVTILPHWVEDGTINTSQTAIWTKVPYIPANGIITLYVYYGNSSATNTSNIDDVMIFGDDFNDGVLDTNKWNVVFNAGYTETNGYLEISNSDTIIHSVNTFSDGVVATFKVKRISVGAGGLTAGGFFGSTTNAILYHMGTTADYNYNDGTWTSLGSVLLQDNVEYYLDVRVVSTTSVEIEAREAATGNQVYFATFSNTVSGEVIRLGRRGDDTTNNTSNIARWDFVFVRQYSEIEPTLSLLAEEFSAIVVVHTDVVSFAETNNTGIFTTHSEIVSLVENSMVDASFSITTHEGIVVSEGYTTTTTVKHTDTISFTEDILYVFSFSESVSFTDVVGQDLTEVWNKYLLTISDLWVYTQYYADTPSITYQGDGEIYFVVTWGTDNTTTYSYDVQRISLTTPTNRGSFVGIYLPIYKLKKTNQDTVIATIRLIID